MGAREPGHGVCGRLDSVLEKCTPKVYMLKIDAIEEKVLRLGGKIGNQICVLFYYIWPTFSLPTFISVYS